MKKKLLTKKLLSFLAVGLSVVTFATSLSSGVTLSSKQIVLTAQADEGDYIAEEEEDTRFVESIATIFPEENVSLNTEEDNAWVEFIGTTCIVDNEEITIECTFDPDEMTFSTVVSDESGYSETMENVAYVNDKGGLDAGIEVPGIDGILYIDDYKNDVPLSDLTQAIVDGEEDIFGNTTSTVSANARALFGWGLFRRVIAVVVVVYVIVAETAEQIKARSNYRYNRSLETNGDGQPFGTKITSQSSNPCAGYRFGFASFSGVGCEVASVYNLQIELGSSQDLSQVIYDFERWAIEFSVGWGHLGSNPREIYRYLKKMDIGYSRYLTFSRFTRAVGNSESEHYILSRTNEDFFNRGLHTFYVNCYYASNGDPSYHAYNNTMGDATNISDYVQGEQVFLVGYIILE